MSPAVEVDPDSVDAHAAELPPTLDHVLGQVAAMGVPAEAYPDHSAQRWGPGWKLNPQGRQRAYGELEGYRNDSQGYADKIGTELQHVVS